MDIVLYKEITIEESVYLALEINRRKLKVKCSAERVDHNAWLRALNLALEGNSKYKQVDLGILREA